MKSNPLGLSTFEEKCLRRAHVFKAICQGIDRAHYPDALHLWTAEENNLDVFLTTDRRFRNVIDRQNIELHCHIMFPNELICL
jgi:predicted nucleic acid-binding protein